MSTASWGLPRGCRSWSRIVLSLLCFSLAVVSRGWAQGMYAIDPLLSTIDGSVKYTVLGRYRAHFRDYSGTFVFYPDALDKSSVALQINAVSIESKHPGIDDVVRSPQLLDAAKFPHIVFVSKAIRPLPQPPEGSKARVYEVTGLLTLHGVTREIAFPFTVFDLSPGQDKGQIRARGVWVINRKDFAIVWHPFLDKGGIIVGNHLTVSWEIVGVQQ